MFGDGFLCFVRQICDITWNMVCVQSYLEVCWAKVCHKSRYVTYKCGRARMSFLSWSRTLRRRRFVKTGVWILIIVVIKIRIQYSGVLGFHAAWIGGCRRLGTICRIFRGPICCSKTSVTTNLRCVTSQKSEDLICIVAEAWNRARMQYFGSLVFVLGKFHILSWCSSELPDGCWNSTFKWRSAAATPVALFRLTLYKDLNKIRSKYFHLLRCDAVCLVEVFQRFIGTCWWWWQQVSLRWRNISTDLHDVTSQKTASLRIYQLTISQQALVLLTLCRGGCRIWKLSVPSEYLFLNQRQLLPSDTSLVLWTAHSMNKLLFSEHGLEWLLASIKAKIL